MNKIARRVLGAVSVLACAIGVSSAGACAVRRDDLQRPPVHRRRRLQLQDNAAGDRCRLDGRDQLLGRRVRLHVPGQHLAEQAHGRQRRCAAARPELHRDVERRRPATCSSTPRTPASRWPAGRRCSPSAAPTRAGAAAVTGRAWGGTSNTALQFSGANLINSFAGLTGPTFSGSVTSAFASVVNPYSLTIGMQITRASAGTTTGNLNLQISPVPEPSTWATDTHGRGTGRLRLAPAPPALGGIETQSPLRRALSFQRRAARLSRAWFGARTSAAGDSR